MLTFFYCAISFAAGLTVAFLGCLRVATRHKKQLEDLKKEHQKDWQDFISDLNHNWEIPHAATATGLTALILSALSRCIISLESLLKAKDYDTRPVISELRGILMVELQMLHKKLGDFLQAQRDRLREYDNQQQNKERKR